MMWISFYLPFLGLSVHLQCEDSFFNSGNFSTFRSWIFPVFAFWNSYYMHVGPSWTISFYPPRAFVSYFSLFLCLCAAFHEISSAVFSSFPILSSTTTNLLYNPPTEILFYTAMTIWFPLKSICSLFLNNICIMSSTPSSISLIIKKFYNVVFFKLF